MKICRKIFSVFLCAVLVGSFFTVSAHAATDSHTDTASGAIASTGGGDSGGTADTPSSTVVLSVVTDKTSASPGDTVTVSLTVSENSGIVSGIFSLTYDDSQLAYVTHDGGIALPGGTIENNPAAKAVVLTLTPAQGLAPVTAGGQLMFASFTVKEGTEGKDLSVILSVSDVKGANGDVTLNLEQKATVTSVCKAHELVGTITTAEANCIAPKTHSQLCKRCNKQISTAEGAALGHQWGDWTVDLAATCSAPGKQTHKCGRAGCPAPVETVDISPLPHTWAAEMPVITAPTCLLAGSGQGTCTVCGASGVVVVPALGHAYTSVQQIVAPTCTDTGFSQGMCERCGDDSPIIVPELGHKVAEWVIDDSVRCLQPGVRRGTCATCQQMVEEYMDQMAHVYANPVVLKPATETEYGEQQVTCTRCGQTSLQLIPPVTIDPITGLPVTTDGLLPSVSVSGTESDSGETTDPAVGPGGVSGGSQSSDLQKKKEGVSTWLIVVLCSGALLLIGTGLVIFFVLKKKRAGESAADAAGEIIAEEEPVPVIPGAADVPVEENFEDVSDADSDESAPAPSEGAEPEEISVDPVPAAVADAGVAESQAESSESEAKTDAEGEEVSEEGPGKQKDIEE